jgi:F-type H+-transporting ATPase subunit a
MGEALKANNIFDIHIFGVTIPITDSIIVMWIIMAVLIIGSILLTRNLKKVPTGKQNIVEAVVGFVNKLAKENIGHHWRAFAPYLGTVLLFLAVANIASIFAVFPVISGFKIIPPTKDLNVTATMGAMSILLVLWSGLWYKKPLGWLKSLAKPSPIMIPFNILDYGTRFLSLSLRLFGNILAGFIVMELIYGLVAPVVPAVLSIYFDLFDGLLQAYIFVFLTSIYISEAVE